MKESIMIQSLMPVAKQRAWLVCVSINREERL